MASEHVAAAGEALDLICYRHYGETTISTALVLEANPHLRDIAHALPAGSLVKLPEFSVQLADAPLRLWD